MRKFILLVFISFFGCNDFGQSYKEVKIGTQIWMAENLNVDEFRNGEQIPQAKTDAEWKIAGENKQPAWCYYLNEEENGIKYGKLYNWYAVTDVRSLAPKGWHIPTELEWKTLAQYLEGVDLDYGRKSSYLVSGKKLKTTSGWYDDNIFSPPNDNGTNESGFSGLPGGYRNLDGTFSFIGSMGHWWNISQFEDNMGVSWFMNYQDGLYLSGVANNKGYGYSVRCVRD